MFVKDNNNNSLSISKGSKAKNGKRNICLIPLFVLLIGSALSLISYSYFHLLQTVTSANDSSTTTTNTNNISSNARVEISLGKGKEEYENNIGGTKASDEYDSKGCLTSLTYVFQDDAFNSRHMVTPPQTGEVTLVCCQSTAGPISIAVHEDWAPLGAQRFLHMVDTGYFSNVIPLFRCIKNFLCQFGLAAGSRELNKPYSSMKDDPSWLPFGPDYRENDKGVKRYQKGYMAYAGGGQNSRSNQFIMALRDNRFLGGGSPWEVPWGEVVGKKSYGTLDNIFTGYGEEGPSQGLIPRTGSVEVIKKDFPDLDYMVSCEKIESRSL